MGGRVRLEPLPAYAPDLNPAEWLWKHLKRVEMRNLVCLDLDASGVPPRRRPRAPEAEGHPVLLRRSRVERVNRSVYCATVSIIATYSRMNTTSQLMRLRSHSRPGSPVA